MRRRAGLLVLLALTGCAGQDDSVRILGNYDSATRFTGLTVNQMRLLPGVSVTGSAGTSVECFDGCSSATVTVAAGPAAAGPLSLDAVLARYAQLVAATVGSERPEEPCEPDLASTFPQRCGGLLDGVGSVRLTTVPAGGYELSFE